MSDKKEKLRGIGSDGITNNGNSLRRINWVPSKINADLHALTWPYAAERFAGPSKFNGGRQSVLDTQPGSSDIENLLAHPNNFESAYHEAMDHQKISSLAHQIVGQMYLYIPFELTQEREKMKIWRDDLNFSNEEVMFALKISKLLEEAHGFSILTLLLAAREAAHNLHSTGRMVGEQYEEKVSFILGNTEHRAREFVESFISAQDSQLDRATEILEELERQNIVETSVRYSGTDKRFRAHYEKLWQKLQAPNPDYQAILEEYDRLIDLGRTHIDSARPLLIRVWENLVHKELKTNKYQGETGKQAFQRIVDVFQALSDRYVKEHKTQYPNTETQRCTEDLKKRLAEL